MDVTVQGRQGPQQQQPGRSIGQGAWTGLGGAESHLDHAGLQRAYAFVRHFGSKKQTLSVSTSEGGVLGRRGGSLGLPGLCFCFCPHSC